jgi:DNA-binding transcriptional LysR family regulator
MELYQLRCFITAAQYENFSRAAEAVHISQSSISKIISRLEEELEVSLFDRSKGKISLNTNGILFLKYATTAVEELDQGVTMIRQRSNTQSLTLSVGCTASELFDGVIEEVQAMDSQYLLEVQVMPQDDLVKAFEHGSIDIGFLESNTGFDSPRFEAIAKQYFVVMMNENHPMAAEKVFPPKKINEEIVCFTGLEYDRRYLRHLFASEGVKPRVFAEYPNPKATAQLINSGTAVGIVPDELYYHRKRITPKIPLVALPISEHWFRYIYMMKQSNLPPQKAELVDLVYTRLKNRFVEEREQIYTFYHEQDILFWEESK